MDNENYCTMINGNTEEVLIGIKKSAQKIADIVSKTAGPYGGNVMLINGKTCRITKDGISVLRSMVEPETESDFIALSVIRSASDETNRKAGDGTTATCILANEVLQKGHQFLTAGVNGNLLRKGIIKASDMAQKMVEKYIAKPVKDDKDIYNVAKISANGSDEIAKILTNVFSQIGKDGMARVELSNTDRTTSKIVYGMTFDHGYESAYFANNTHGEAVLENPIILIVNKKLSVLGEILKPFEALAKMNRPILVIGDGFDQDIINTFILNKMRGLPICVVQAPSYNPHKTEMMTDISIITGGKVISPSTGVTLEQVATDPTILGQAKQVIVTSDTTSIIVDENVVNQTEFDKRIEEINNQLEDEVIDDRDRNILKIRKARMCGGIGIISVGGATEAEMHEKKDLVDDAFASVSYAQKKGIVPGSGLTYLAIHDALYAWLSNHIGELTQEEASGFKVFADSLTKPFLSICGNSGGNNAQFLLGCIQNTNRNIFENSPREDGQAFPWTSGVDLGSGEPIDAIKMGIIDSAAAVIETLKNAASAGSQLLSLMGTVNTPPKQIAQPQMGM